MPLSIDRCNQPWENMALHRVDSSVQDADGWPVRRGLPDISKLLYESFTLSSSGELLICTSKPETEALVDGGGGYTRIQFGQKRGVGVTITQGIEPDRANSTSLADFLIDRTGEGFEAGTALYQLRTEITSDGTPGATITTVLEGFNDVAGSRSIPFALTTYANSGPEVCGVWAWSGLSGPVYIDPAAAPTIQLICLTDTGDELGTLATLGGTGTFSMRASFLYLADRVYP